MAFYVTERLKRISFPKVLAVLLHLRHPNASLGKQLGEGTGGERIAISGTKQQNMKGFP